MRAYKRVIDDGYAQTFAEGLRLETDASRAHARTLTAETIATRRTGVQARGREQKGKQDSLGLCLWIVVRGFWRGQGGVRITSDADGHRRIER